MAARQRVRSSIRATCNKLRDVCARPKLPPKAAPDARRGTRPADCFNSSGQKRSSSHSGWLASGSKQIIRHVRWWPNAIATAQRSSCTIGAQAERRGPTAPFWGDREDPPRSNTADDGTKLIPRGLSDLTARDALHHRARASHAGAGCCTPGSVSSGRVSPGRAGVSRVGAGV